MWLRTEIFKEKEAIAVVDSELQGVDAGEYVNVQVHCSDSCKKNVYDVTFSVPRASRPRALARRPLASHC